MRDAENDNKKQSKVTSLYQETFYGYDLKYIPRKYIFSAIYKFDTNLIRHKLYC